MNKAFEKIIEKLEEYKYENLVEYDSEQLQHCKDVGDCGMRDCTLCVFDKAIEIVKQEAEQYSTKNCSECSRRKFYQIGYAEGKKYSGWIPCSERLPEENGYYYVTQIVKSVSTGKKIAIEKDYVEFSKGEWRRAKHLEVIAWIDIEPYQPKGE